MSYFVLPILLLISYESIAEKPALSSQIEIINLLKRTFI